MKPGIEHGSGIVDVTVTEEMTAKLEGVTVHPVYATFWIVYHAEVAARRAIEPFFEDGDNAIGVSVSVNHRASAQIGQHVRITATVTEVRNRFVGCEISVVTVPDGTLIAEGSQGQVIRYGETGRQRDRETERQRDGETERQRDGETGDN